VAVFPTASLHAEAHFTFLHEKLIEPLSKDSDKCGFFDQITAEMYVICTLLGEVTDNGTFRELARFLVGMCRKYRATCLRIQTEVP
jgi:hypothetical protein